MVTQTELNLIGVVSPVCLLKCKSALAEMKAGDTIDVLLQDPEVAEKLVKIIGRSSDRVIQFGREADYFRIKLERG